MNSGRSLELWSTNWTKQDASSYSETETLLSTQKESETTYISCSQATNKPSVANNNNHDKDTLKSTEFVYQKLNTVRLDEEKPIKCELWCCQCQDEPDNMKEASPIKLAHLIGYKAILHIMFSSNPSKVYIVLKFVLLLAYFLASMGLVVLNCIALSCLKKEYNDSVRSMIIMMIVLSLALLAYTAVDFISHIRFIVTIICHGVRLSSLKSSYVHNVLRHIIPDTILYPLFVVSMCSILSAPQNDSSIPPLIGYNITFDRMDTLTKLMNISMLCSGFLLILMVYIFRLQSFIRLIYLVMQAQRFHNFTTASKARNFGILFMLLFQAVILSTTQILLLCVGLGNINSSLHVPLFGIVSGYMCYTIGMFMFYSINFEFFRGVCVEFFHNICSKIIESNQHLRASDDQTTTLPFVAKLRESSDSAAIDGYPSCSWDAINQISKTIGFCLFVAIYYGTLIYYLIKDGLFYLNSDDYYHHVEMRAILEFVTAAFICLAHLQTLLIGSISVIAIAITIVFLIVAMPLTNLPISSGTHHEHL